MIADLRDEISAALAGHLARELTVAWPDFPRCRFVRALDDSLALLVLMARVELLTSRLVEALPERLRERPELAPGGARLGELQRVDDAAVRLLSGRGWERPTRPRPAVARGPHPRWSSEGSIRPFIERHPEVTYEPLRRWVLDPDEHVRRLVSEGTRPRLPWAAPLRSLVADPTPNLELLDRLVGDPSQYVRRSVANHLNDISEDHPALAVALARDWLRRGKVLEIDVRAVVVNPARRCAVFDTRRLQLERWITKEATTNRARNPRPASSATRLTLSVPPARPRWRVLEGKQVARLLRISPVAVWDAMRPAAHRHTDGSGFARPK